MNLFNHLNPHISTLILFIISILILYFLQFDKDYIKIFLLIWTIDLAPAFYLHIEYWRTNKKDEYEITNNSIIQIKNKKETVILTQEIEKITLHLAPSLTKNSNFHFLAIESYHYAKIHLYSGEKLIITSLLSPRIDKALQVIRGVNIEMRTKLFNPLS